MKIREIEAYFNALYPTLRRSAWDHDGLLVCPDRDREVRRVATCLDVTFSVIEEAAARGCELIVSHHPLIFHPLQEINETTLAGQKVLLILQQNLSVLSLHTRLDGAVAGLGDHFAALLGIRRDHSVTLLPEEPYIGGVGLLEKKVSPEEFAQIVSTALCAPVRLYSAGLDIERVGYCCGSGKGMVEPALRLGAEAFVGGDLSYHEVLDAVEQGMTVIDCGHHASEKGVAQLLADALAALDESLTVFPIEEARGGEIVDASLFL